jgi:hypothetical protein
MVITFSGALLAAITLVVLGSVGITVVHYGLRLFALAGDLRDCRNHMELRVAMRPSPVIAFAPRKAVSSPPVPGCWHAGLRAAA